MTESHAKARSLRIGFDPAGKLIVLVTVWFPVRPYLRCYGSTLVVVIGDAIPYAAAPHTV